MVNQLSSKTAQQVADYVKRQFGDESGVQIQDADIFRWINAGQYEIFRRNEPIKATGTADLISGQHTYTFPNDVLKVQSILVNGIPVSPRSYQDAEEYVLGNDPNRVQTGQPQLWWEWGGSFTFWPTPDVDATGGITIRYIKTPNNISNLADVLSVPDTLFNRLVEFVMGQAYELDENWAAADSKAAQFAQNLDSQAADKNIQYATYPVITVLEEDL